MVTPVIRIDDEGVTRELPDGKTEHVAWDDLIEVSVVTTEEGPFVEDVFFVLLGENDTGCVVPHGAPESTQLSERFARLPGFDYEAALRAMKSTHNERFVCWRR